MRYILIFFILTSTFCLFAGSSQDIGERIQIDGYTNDWQTDEYLLMDADGNSLEGANDSHWGEYNELTQVRATWDNEYLYLGVDGVCKENNVILFIDIYDDYGITDMTDLRAWQRAFQFYNLSPDFFIGTWDTNTAPQFWRVDEGSRTSVRHANETSGESGTDAVLPLTTAASFDGESRGRALEAKIRLDSLYYNAKRRMENYPLIKILAVLTSGGDNQSGPDVAPDNIGGMSNDGNRIVIIDNYIEINIDSNGDGQADMNVSPASIRTFYMDPPLKANPLKMLSVNFPNGRTFAPTIGSILAMDLTVNRSYEINPTLNSAFFSYEIYNLDGELIGPAPSSDATRSNQEMKFVWDGRDFNSQIVPFGIYIVRFTAATGELSRKEAVVVVK